MEVIVMSLKKNIQFSHKTLTHNKIKFLDIIVNVSNNKVKSYNNKKLTSTDKINPK